MNQFQGAFGHQGDPILLALIFICGEQWKLQSTKTFPLVDIIRRKPSLILSGISPILNQFIFTNKIKLIDAFMP
jgi:hypothetical protein